MNFEYKMTNAELEAAIAYAYERTGSTTRGKSMQKQLNCLLDLQKQRAKLDSATQRQRQE